MSVYVGIGVHRKRSQIAVVDHDSTLRANRNIPNGPEASSILRLTGPTLMGGDMWRRNLQRSC